MYNIASPILYSIIVSDNLHSLVYNLSGPHITQHIFSKTELFGYTRRLYFEYGLLDDPTYDDIFHNDEKAYARCGPSSKEVTAMCRAESMEICNVALRLSKRLTLLTSIALGSFINGQKRLWKQYEQSGMTKLNDVRCTSVAFTQLFTITPKALYTCQRTVRGPLTFLAKSWPILDKHRVPPLSRCRAHVEGFLRRTICSHQPLPYSSFSDQMKLQMAKAMAGEVDSTTEKLNLIWFEVFKTLNLRLVSPGQKQSQSELRRNGDHFDIELYVDPIDFGADIAYVQQVVDEAVSDHYARRIGEHMREEKDIWRVRDIREAPSCEACLWTKEDLRIPSDLDL